MPDHGFSVLTRTALLLATALICLSACSNTPGVEKKYPTGENRETSDDPYQKPDSVFSGGLNLFGHGTNSQSDSGNSGIGVNSYLWHASLDTISFMPIASADPFGGTILTDWYATPGNSNERYKMNVFILDRQLRSDGVQVKVFKQTYVRGGWRDAAVPESMARKIEDEILIRARQMRIAQMGNH
jgi:hypothetical protein